MRAVSCVVPSCDALLQSLRCRLRRRHTHHYTHREYAVNSFEYESYSANETYVDELLERPSVETYRGRGGGREEGSGGPHTAGERESLSHDGSTTSAVSYGHAGLSQPVEARESTPQTIHTYGVGESETSSASEKESEGVRVNG